MPQGGQLELLPRFPKLRAPSSTWKGGRVHAGSALSLSQLSSALCPLLPSKEAETEAEAEVLVGLTCPRGGDCSRD